MVPASRPHGPARPLGLRRMLLRHRRMLAALLVCAAVGVGIESLAPRTVAAAPVVAAAEDLPVGTVLTKSHLTVRRLPRDALPQTALIDTAAAEGKQLATPLRAGDVLAETFLVGPGLLAGAPPGSVAVPVRPADPATVQLLAPGMRVDVVVSSDPGYEGSTETSVLASGLPVLWTSAGESGGGWPGAPAETGLVVLAARPGEAAALAGSSGGGRVHLILTGR